MAKFGSFFRRLFTSLVADENDTPIYSTSQSRKSIVIISPSTPPALTRKYPPHRLTNASRSCSTSPRFAYRTVTKQATIHMEPHHSPYQYPVTKGKVSNRRLSAPLIIHSSVHHPRPCCPSAVPEDPVDENDEDALISPLQRLSLSSTNGSSSTHPNYSISSRGTSATGSANASPRNDYHFSSVNLSPSNSIHLPSSSLNTISSASGTPPSQFVLGQSSTSPRVSLQSNNSISPSTDRKMSLQTRGRRPSMFDPIDPKELQQALYASAAAKASIPSNASEEEVLTRALARLTVRYDRERQHICLESFLIENFSLIDAFLPFNSETISFYCRFRLLPDKRSLFQTKILRFQRQQTSFVVDEKQLNDFDLTFEQLATRSIEIFFYKISSNKTSTKDIRFATIKFDLNELMKIDQIQMIKKFDEFDVNSVQDADLGELLISLSYLQSAAKLAVVIHKANCLRPLALENRPLPEAFVKVTLYDRHGKKMKRKRTTVQRPSDCPTFNEELVFELRRDLAAEVTIEVRIVHESLSHKEQLGSLIFGPLNNTKGLFSPENLYWSAILSGESLNGQWHMLKSSIKTDESK